MKWLVRRFRLPPRRIVLWHSIASLPLGTIVAFGAYLSFHYHVLSDENRMHLNRSYQLLDGVDGLFASVEAAALAERDFVITGDNEALVEFRQASSNFKGQVQQLSPLVRDESSRLADLSRIDRAVAAEFDKFAQVIDVRQTQGYDGARALVALQGTSASMANLRRQIAEMTAAERVVVNARIEAEQLHERHVIWTGISVAISSILVRLGIAVWMRRMSRLRERAAGVLAGDSELPDRISSA